MACTTAFNQQKTERGIEIIFEQIFEIKNKSTQFL